jgi:uncharacterized protein YbjT (DUF2867 family)
MESSLAAMDRLGLQFFTGGMTTLVTGGTGKTGRRVVRRLVERGLPVRIGSRSGGFDWTDPRTWSPALGGVSDAYLVYSPDVAAPGAASAIGAFTDLAVRKGVRRLVLLSGRGEGDGLPTEQAVRDSGAEWTILRASWFAQNFSEGFLLPPLLRGHVVLPAGDVAEPFVDAEDIADVAVAALTEDRHVGQIYELTGPRLITFGDAVTEIAQASGRELVHLPGSTRAFATVLAEDDRSAAFLSELFTKALDGRNAHVTDDVQRAIGLVPRDFGDYVRETAATGVWDA